VLLFFSSGHSKKSEKSSSLFQSLEFFVSKLSRSGVEGAVRCFSGLSEPPILSPRNEEVYARAKCDVILYVLQFVGVLVDRRHDSPSSVSRWEKKGIKKVSLIFPPNTVDSTFNSDITNFGDIKKQFSHL